MTKKKIPNLTMEQNDHHKFYCNLASFKIVYYMSKINTRNSSYNHPTSERQLKKNKQPKNEKKNI